jgi:hypothetical protein
MAVSNITTFTVTRDEIINGALRLCGVLQEGQTANATQLTDAAQSLNLLLKYYATKGWLLWCYYPISFTTVVNKGQYVIGPSGPDVTDNKPLRVARGYIRATANSLDIPLNHLTRQGYDMLSPKTQTGVPNSFYIDQQRDTAICYLWPVPIDITHTIVLTTQRQIMDITTGAQNFDLPQEWFLPLKWNLAADIGPEFGVTERAQQRIDAKAEFYLGEVSDFSSAEEPSVTFTPNLTMSLARK